MVRRRDRVARALGVISIVFAATIPVVWAAFSLIVYLPPEIRSVGYFGIALMFFFTPLPPVGIVLSITGLVLGSKNRAAVVVGIVGLGVSVLSTMLVLRFHGIL